MTFLAGQHPSITFISHRALPLIVVVLIVLAGAFLFASWGAPSQPLQSSSYSTAFEVKPASSESDLLNQTSMLSAPENYGFDSVLLHDDSDNENVDDGTFILLEVLGIVSSLILLLLGGKPLLACYQQTEKLSSICCLALERPG